jgi:hypothetical protein
MTTPVANFEPTLLYNMVPGQYQIGNRVIGRGTTVRIETFEVKPYDQNNQDYQVTFSDQVNFGQDTFKPSTIEMTFDVINNKLRPGYEALIPNFWDEMPTVSEFSAIWRNDPMRLQAGSMVPLYICGKDGVTRVVYGRPGQFTYTKEEEYDEFTQCLGEFRRGDTLAYTAKEEYFKLEQNSAPIYFMRENGDGPDSWLRLLLVGPLTNPVITIGGRQLRLNFTIEAGNIAEISSYPWARRAVDANGLNLSEFMIGKDQYLDKFVFPYAQPVPLKWTSDEVNTFVPVLGDQNWHENIDGYSMFAPPPGFAQINSQTAVRFDLFNWSVANSLIPTPRKYLGAALGAVNAASIYTLQKFNTPNQRAETQVVNPGLWLGQSVLTIMTNATMSQLVGVMVDNQIVGQHYLRIVSGSWDNMLVHSSWHYPNPLGFNEHCKVGISYEPTTKTYTAWFTDGITGWQSVASWPDTSDTIPTGVDNRYQGYVFNVNGAPVAVQGCGFCNTLAYDTLSESTQLGEVYVLWRDSWSTVG